MGELDLSEELESLRASAARFAAEQLAPVARAAESAGRWPGEALSVLESFSLRGLDLPARLGGDERRLPRQGRPARDARRRRRGRPARRGSPRAWPRGRSSPVPIRAWPARSRRACLAGRAQCALRRGRSRALRRSPRSTGRRSWPALRWLFVSEGERLRALELTPPARARAGAGLSRVGRRARARLGRAHARRLEALDADRCRDPRPGAALARGGRRRRRPGRARRDDRLHRERIVFGKPVAHHQGNAFELAVPRRTCTAPGCWCATPRRRFDRGEPDAGFWATQAWLGDDGGRVRRDQPRHPAARRARLHRRPPRREALPRGAHAGACSAAAATPPRSTWPRFVLDVADPLLREQDASR